MLPFLKAMKRKSSRGRRGIPFWKKYVAEDRIILCGKKDNFWEWEKQVRADLF
jgi:hypothetical protein